MYSLLTLLLTIVFLCSLPAYLLARKSLRESLLAAEEGFSTSSCLIFYTLTGLVMLLLMLLCAYNTAALLLACTSAASIWWHVNTFTSLCATFLLAWGHIHTRRACQRRKGKIVLSRRISSLLSGIINSIGFICLFLGLVDFSLALLGIIIFVLRYMLSYTAHRK